MKRAKTAYEAIKNWKSDGGHYLSKGVDITRDGSNYWVNGVDYKTGFVYGIKLYSSFSLAEKAINRAWAKAERTLWE